MRGALRVVAMIVSRRRFYLRILLILIPLIFFSLHVSSRSSSRVSSFSASRDTFTQDSINDHALILSMVPQVLHKFLVLKPTNASSLKGNGELMPEEILRNIHKYNAAQTIINENIFGPVQNDTIIIVIQVHKRIVYLRHLIVSLAQGRGIEKTLIIFSHDFYDPELNELVQSVDFARVMQIFYPFSIQTHPDTFPGQAKGDCPRNINHKQAQILKCTNADHPDLYGHYREAKYTQIKHHWWWKANRVFNELEVTRNHAGLVLFLEEDHYVAEDFLHLLRLMQIACSTTCPQCSILSLGTDHKTSHNYRDNEKVEVTPWISNLGMAFNRSVWIELHKCAKFFCSHDDYNWDWSLQEVSQQCLKSKLISMVMKSSRVLHIGYCGVHKKANCESTALISKVQKVLAKAKRNLYPKQLTLNFINVENKDMVRKGNGGWGDIRDHELCMNMSFSTR
ncbi:alpha-1,6-mannosyl-glycoprotein 2-beta-N-acetylglucosaminyltransferase [Halyomorpha halys]|uniref:alpha-1,6-mannosyl-glycoprotein 2-beta-N-acetylglucosaminyltransferase n=1 Tax=Halyomorpha halys TaxID=286706 RepID=UPI0006D4FF83|nr:alpha-1,6-mannosyl-glycoprotein 2-beta-N-acetylglucosaminyltransferase-like [Halyomorpha halys]XP_024215779.1 alpha-1,6-mannosyl-glycoprotein 2-beta-N-acetylglucosaminyltransferase-like [Halyomorpha halys]XP_024215807.1 alpha-1,6-mannosyl-glycoprotein 2-beta-N-acetylglucosaminyltransferase-like [Halyomorpha halys]